MNDRCANCGWPIRQINYALGPQWMHVAPGSSWPSKQRGTAWRYCRQYVARPSDRIGVHFIPYGSYIASCGYIEDQRHPERQSDMRRDVTCPDCQKQMTDHGDLPPPTTEQPDGAHDEGDSMDCTCIGGPHGGYTCPNCRGDR